MTVREYTTSSGSAATDPVMAGEIAFNIPSIAPTSSMEGSCLAMSSLVVGMMMICE